MRACGYGKGGLSSISVGGRGTSFNTPVERSGGPRTTVGLPDTGLSWRLEHTPDRPGAIPTGAAQGLPNSRSPAGQEQHRICINACRQTLFIRK